MSLECSSSPNYSLLLGSERRRGVPFVDDLGCDDDHHPSLRRRKEVVSKFRLPTLIHAYRDLASPLLAVVSAA